MQFLQEKKLQFFQTHFFLFGFQLLVFKKIQFVNHLKINCLLMNSSVLPLAKELFWLTHSSILLFGISEISVSLTEPLPSLARGGEEGDKQYNILGSILISEERKGVNSIIF